MSNVLIERRKYLRLDYLIPVSVKITNGKSGKVYQGFSRDISFGGIGIEFNTAVLTSGNETLNAGDIIEVQTEFPKTGLKINARGNIRWLTSDQATGKTYFGLQFLPDTDPEDIFILYNYAKKEIRNKSISRKLFSLSIIAVMFLSLWGIKLHVRNTILLQQIHKLDVMRIEMEKNLVSLRLEKKSLQDEIKNAMVEKKSLDSSLCKLKEKTVSLNNIILDLENRLDPAAKDISNDTPAGNEPSAKPEIGTPTTKQTGIAGEINAQILFIEKKLSENETILANLKNRYENLDKTLGNRLRAKKFLDEEIKYISGRTAPVFSSLSAMNDLKQSGYDDLPRCIWTADQDIFKFRSKTDDMLQFCKERNISLIFANFDFSDEICVSQIPGFLERAHNYGIHIHAYYNMNRPTAEKNRIGCLNWVANVLELNKTLPEEIRIAGINIQIDTENINHSNIKDYLTYLEMLEKLVVARNNKNSILEIGVTVKLSFADSGFVFQYKGIQAQFNLHVIDLADYILIQNINSAESAIEEIKRAETNGKKVYLGARIDISCDQYSPSLSGQYINDMETKINSIIEYYIDRPAFMGISIQDYESYSKCIEDNTPEYIKNNRMPVISRRPPKIEYKGPAIYTR